MLNFGLYAVACMVFLLNSTVNRARFVVLWMPVFQAVGIVVYFSLEREPTILLLGTLIILSFTLLIAAVAYRIPLLLVIVLVMVGFGGAYIKTLLCHPRSFCVQRKTYAKSLLGAVRAIDHKPQYVQMFICEIDCGKSEKYCARVSVRTAIDPLIEVGDRVVFSAVLHPPGPPDSANGFDFARYAYFKGIAATGFAVSEVQLYAKSERVKLHDWIERIRTRGYERFLLYLSEDCAEMLAALLIGKRSGLRAEVLTNMRNSGLAHLLAISGLHLSFVAGITFLFFRCLVAFTERISLNYDAKKLCAVAAIVLSFFYLLVAGMPISARRAFVMVFMAFCGIMINRRHAALASVSVAAFVMLLFSPEAVFSPSFQMSFAAVLALITTGGLLASVTFPAGSVAQYVAKTAISSCIAAIATAPYVIYHFHYFSIVGVLANIIAVPITTFVVMPLGIVYQIIMSTSLRVPISYLLEHAVGVVLGVAKLCARSEWAITNFSAIPGGAVLLISCGMIVACCARGAGSISGVAVGALGAVWAALYNTPDIILDQKSVVVKDIDSQLYFCTLNGSGRGRRYTKWASDNKQRAIYKHIYTGKEGRLRCFTSGCIYLGRVIISQHADFLISHCNGAELIIYNGFDLYPAVCAGVRHITLSDIYNYGVHYVWLRRHSILVERSVTQRLWHKNSMGYLR